MVGGKLKKLSGFLRYHLVRASILVSVMLGVLFYTGVILWDIVIEKHKPEGTELLISVPVMLLLITFFFIYPVVLTLMEILLLFVGVHDQKCYRGGRYIDIITIGLGTMFTLFYLSILRSVVWADWTEILSNAEVHSPIAPQNGLTIVAILLISMAGYLIANFVSLKNMPPLLMVLSLSAMYLSAILGLVWLVHIFPWKDFTVMDGYLILLPCNLELITARTVMGKMNEWRQLEHNTDRYQGKGFLRWCNRILMNASAWPFAAFLLMWPLLGMIIMVLVLFGQAPNAIIKAFTETSDWNLSQRVAPQNVYYDEHYLCTVAAGGHRRIVRPERLGIRHGHQVIVNRQLCVANAFEQILEEKTPGFHKSVRHFYDTYGFPIARCIHSQYMADFVYIVMKPLEWLFLAVLYLVDVHPEDRIAIQYTGKGVKDFEQEIRNS